MAMEINRSYSSYAAQGMMESGTVNSAKKKETEKTAEKVRSSRSESTAEYVTGLSKLAPSVEFRVGNTHASDPSGKTLTINPKLLEKMQNDPETEKEMKELIRGVESAVHMMDGFNKASGWTVVFKHCYIDENGKFTSIAYLRNDFMLNMSDELREERRENAEKLLERQKESAAEKKEESEEVSSEKKLEEKEAEKAEEKADRNKAEQLLDEKIAASKDGMIYLYDTDMKTIMEALKEDSADDKAGVKEQAAIVGANVDLKV
ncbi:MAG: hypothetical protein HDR11_16410 [Lachnospiraceae bacterium]|nr:hypothetical protein [Lachnospiraceae bacterium]